MVGLASMVMLPLEVDNFGRVLLSGVENGWTMDAVITNAAQFANTHFANTQLSLASQEEQPPVLQDQVSTHFRQ